MQQRPGRQHRLFRFGQVAASAVTCAALIGVSLVLAAPARAEITAVTPPALPAALTAGQSIAPDLSFTSDSINPVTFAVSAGALPGGLTLAPSGLLAGTPTLAGSFTFTVAGTDDVDATTASASLTVAVNAALTPAGQAAVTGVVGLPLTTAPLTPIGFPADPTLTSFAVTPGLPAGLSLDPATQAIKGTPTATAVAQEYVITATSGLITAKSTVTISVPPAAVTPATTTLVAPLNEAITPIVFTAAGFATPPALTLPLSPALPAGITFTPATGTLSGTPTQASPVTTYTVTATSGVAPDAVTTAAATITLSVTALALAPRSIVANVGTTITPSAGYTATEFTTAGLVGTPTLAVSPALPAGLTMSATTGAITGKPTVAVTTPVEHTITATDANGVTATGIVTVTVSSTQLEAPVIYYAQAGTSSGSLRVLFLGPANAPTGQTYSAEVYDATGATLVKTVSPMTSLTDIIGLTPGTTYSVIIVAQASSGYLAARSAPKTGVASLGGTKLIPPTITSISGGPAIGSISVSFNPTPNAPAGLTYTVQVYDEDQLTLITAVAKAVSPTLVTGLTPGVTYFVYVAADATATTLESLSRGRTVMATASKATQTNAAMAATVAFPSGSAGSAARGASLGAGWALPTGAQAAKAKRVTVTTRPATTPRKAPIVKVPAKRAVTLRIKGLTPQALYVADAKLAGKWANLGSARATWGGAVDLPPFSANSPGTYLLRLTAMGQSPAYLKVLVVKKGAA